MWQASRLASLPDQETDCRTLPIERSGTLQRGPLPVARKTLGASKVLPDRASNRMYRVGCVTMRRPGDSNECATTPPGLLNFELRTIFQTP